MAKVKFQNTDVEAIKEFTDREDPQEAFERKFRVLSENWKEEYYVLCYYGIGGVGKTSFLDKLCRVIRGVEGNETRLLDKIDCNYIRYDFDAKSSGTDKLTILLSLRRQLGEVEKNFKFFRFDSAVLLYAKKNGISIEKDETAQSLLESNPWLDAVISTVGTVPVIGWVSGVIQAIDKSAKTAKEAIGKHMDESRYKYHLNEIDGMELPELLENLHRYFIEDMKYNMQQVATKPLVVFLDTYEKYIDTVNNERRMLIEDYWLRKGSRSVIQSVPGVLWVIAGREKLYWDEDDTNWGKMAVESPLSQMSEEEKEVLARTDLEQHLLGDLSLKDATKFLQKAGVYDAVLCEQLHKLTNGTPLFLDMCVDTYHELCNNGVQPEISLFGEDIKQLTNRYLFNLNEANREMAYVLACLGTWNDESVRRIAGEATTLRWYTSAKYEEFVDHSFIIKNADGSYYMHETVRSVALKNADKEILEEIGRVKLSVVKESVEAEETLDSGATFGEYTKTLAENSLSYGEFYESLKTAKRKFWSLEEAGDYDALYTSAGEVFRGAMKNYPATGLEYIARSEYGNALKIKGFIKDALEVVSEIPLAENVSDIEEEDWLTVKARISGIYSANGMYQESMELNKQVREGRKRILGEEHPDTLKSMYSLSRDYYCIGEKQKALELAKQLLAVRKRVLGEEHPDTLASMVGLANIYHALGEYQKALELRERTLELSRKVLGEEHPNTLTSMNNLANSYNAMGEKQKALELCEQTLELRRKVLGDEHPDTLVSMTNLAISYNAMGEKQKALELRERTLELRRKVLGDEHPDTLVSMTNLAISYNAMGEKQKEQELKVQEAEIQKRLLEKRKRELGEEHPDTLETMRTLARCYNGIGEKQKARELREQTLELRRKVLGEEHPDTIASLGDLAGSYYNMGEKQKAYEMLEKALDQRKRVQGEAHPDTKKAESLLKIRRLLE